MGELIAQLVPTSLGVVLSPLAIMALVAVLLSKLARVNGVAYLIGWSLGIVGLILIFLRLFQHLEIRTPVQPPLWVSLLRLLFAGVLIGGSVWVYRKGARRTKRMAAATTTREVAQAATLPGWLQSVSSFKPGRCFLLGLGLFVLNPVDASCAVIAALDIALADVTNDQAFVVAIGFSVVGILPIAVPVGWLLVAGERAQPSLDTIRTWIASNTHVLNAALLLVIGVLQLQKAVSALL